MSQIKTYGSGKRTDAQKQWDAERRREREQKEAADLQATLAAVADADIRKVAANIVLEKEKNLVPPDADILRTHEEKKREQREADKARLEQLIEDHKKDKKTFYTGMKMAFGAAMKDMGRSQETARIASRLGMSNPITSGVMGIGTSSGVIQDNVRYVEAICKRFAVRYRATGSISEDDFESPIGA